MSMIEEEPVNMILVLIVIVVIVGIAARFFVPYIADWVYGLPQNPPSEGIIDYTNLSDAELASFCPIRVAELGNRPIGKWYQSLLRYAGADVRELYICEDDSCKEKHKSGASFKQWRTNEKSIVYFKDSVVCRALAGFPFDPDNPLWIQCTVIIGNIENNKLSVFQSSYEDKDNLILSQISFSDLVNLDGSIFFMNHYFCRNQNVQGNLKVGELRDNRIWFLLDNVKWVDTNLLVSGNVIYIKKIAPEYIVGGVSNNKLGFPSYFYNTEIPLEKLVKSNIPSGISESDYRKILESLGNSHFSEIAKDGIYKN